MESAFRGAPIQSVRLGTTLVRGLVAEFIHRKNAVHGALIEDAVVPEAPEVELEALALHAQLAGT